MKVRELALVLVGIVGYIQTLKEPFDKANLIRRSVHDNSKPEPVTRWDSLEAPLQKSKYDLDWPPDIEKGYEYETPRWFSTSPSMSYNPNISDEFGDPLMYNSSYNARYPVFTKIGRHLKSNQLKKRKHHHKRKHHRRQHKPHQNRRIKFYPDGIIKVTKQPKNGSPHFLVEASLIPDFEKVQDILEKQPETQVHTPKDNFFDITDKSQLDELIKKGLTLPPKMKKHMKFPLRMIYQIDEDSDHSFESPRHENLVNDIFEKKIWPRV